MTPQVDSSTGTTQAHVAFPFMKAVPPSAKRTVPEQSVTSICPDDTPSGKGLTTFSVAEPDLLASR